MTKEEVLEFMTKNPVFTLATIDDGRPHARMIMLYRAAGDGIIFSTGREKDVNKQLQSNPAVEMCFYSHEQNRQVRVQGDAEAVNELELKKQIVEDFAFLKPWVEAKGYDVLVTYRIKNAKAVTWTMETNFEPKRYIEL